MTIGQGTELPPANTWFTNPWEHEAPQYEVGGEPGIRYEGHVFSSPLPDGSIGDFSVATLLNRGSSGDLRGILNFFPDGVPEREAAGNFFVIVDPKYRGLGIAKELLVEADCRWKINFLQQDYTAEGRALVAAYLSSRDQS